jgi:hypothetical protein
MERVHVVSMIGSTPETEQTSSVQETSGPANAESLQMASPDVQKIVDTLKAVGRDPATTSLAEAQEICRLLENAKYREERTYFREAIIILGIVVLVSIVGMVILAFSNKALPDSLIAVAAAALGLFAGILVASGKRN